MDPSCVCPPDSGAEVVAAALFFGGEGGRGSEMGSYAGLSIVVLGRASGSLRVYML